MSRFLGRAGSVLFLVLGLIVIGYTGYESAYATGLAGQRGTLKVTECGVRTADETANAARNSRKGRQNIRCDGTFRATDGRAPLAAAHVDTQTVYANGTQLDVTRQSGPTLVPEISTDGGYVLLAPKKALRWIAVLFAGLALTGLGLFCAATGYSPFGRSPTTFDTAWTTAGRTALRPTLIGLLGVGVAGAALAWLVSLFL